LQNNGYLHMFCSSFKLDRIYMVSGKSLILMVLIKSYCSLQWDDNSFHIFIISETTTPLNANLTEMFLWWSSTKFLMFATTWISKMATRANNVFWLAVIAKIFFLTTDLINHKLYMNMVIYKVCDLMLI
jgi:magnesium-transporting ATPase (P-type)